MIINNTRKLLVIIVFTFTLVVAVDKAATSKTHVCVIGAGPAGLIAARFLASYPDEFNFIVFEKNSDVGGLWIYTDSTTVDEHGLPVHSSMYKYLRTNSPREIVRYRDFTEIQGGNSSFVMHETILEYLRNYTEHFHLRPHIQFNVNVEKVSPLPGEKWLVQVRNLNTRELNEISCDAVMVANGHYVKGYIPKIPGIESFSGKVIHSHLYRKPEDFSGQTVVVLGAGFSGKDVAIQISLNAEKVYISSRNNEVKIKFPPNVDQVAGVVAANGNEFILSDNSTIKADVLILCTGYVYDFPFLDETTGIVVDSGKHVKPLYKHLINIEHPTMAIMNILGLRIQMSYAQTPYFLAVLRGNITLPNRKEMLIDSLLPPGKPITKAHRLSYPEVFAYYTELATAAGRQPLPSYVQFGYYAYLPYARIDPVHYREKNLYVYEDGHVEFV